MKTLIFGGSRGIGLALAREFKELGCEVIGLSSADVDTSDLDAMKSLAKSVGRLDVVILNTGGPPPKNTVDIEVEDWEKYHRQLFLGFAVFLNNVKLNDSAYVIQISSSLIKSPFEPMVLSAVYRNALWTLLKAMTAEFSCRQISTLNIAPGPILTGRLAALVDDIDEFSKGLPQHRVAPPEELAKFIALIIRNNVKYLSGQTIIFDGGQNSALF